MSYTGPLKIGNRIKLITSDTQTEATVEHIKNLKPTPQNNHEKAQITIRRDDKASGGAGELLQDYPNKGDKENGWFLVQWEDGEYSEEIELTTTNEEELKELAL